MHQPCPIYLHAISLVLQVPQLLAPRLELPESDTFLLLEPHQLGHPEQLDRRPCKVSVQ